AARRGRGVDRACDRPRAARGARPLPARRGARGRPRAARFARGAAGGGARAHRGPVAGRMALHGRGALERLARRVPPPGAAEGSLLGRPLPDPGERAPLHLLRGAAVRRGQGAHQRGRGGPLGPRFRAHAGAGARLPLVLSLPGAGSGRALHDSGDRAQPRRRGLPLRRVSAQMEARQGAAARRVVRRRDVPSRERPLVDVRLVRRGRRRGERRAAPLPCRSPARRMEAAPREPGEIRRARRSPRGRALPPRRRALPPGPDLHADLRRGHRAASREPAGRMRLRGGGSPPHPSRDPRRRARHAHHQSRGRPERHGPVRAAAALRLTRLRRAMGSGAIAIEDLLYPLLGGYRSAPAWVQAAAGRAYGWLPRSVRLGRAYVDYRRAIEATRDAQRARAYALAKLEETLAWAIETVPAYSGFRTLLRSARDPRELLRALPVTGKLRIKHAPGNYLSSAMPRSAALDTFTGGSTSTPMRFSLQKHVTRPREQAFVADFRARLGAAESDVVLALRGRTVAEAGRGGAPWRYEAIQRQLLVSCDHLEPRWLPQIARALERSRPAFIEAFPSALFALAAWLERHPLPAF